MAPQLTITIDADHPLYNKKLADEYRAACTQIAQNFNQALKLLALPDHFTELAISQDWQDNIVYYTEKWCKKRRFLQTLITIEPPTTSVFIFDQMDSFFNSLRIKIIGLDKIKAKELLNLLDFYQKLHYELLEIYIYQFLRASQNKLKEKIIGLPALNEQAQMQDDVASFIIDDTTAQTRHQAIVLHGKGYALANEIKKISPSDTTLIELFSSINNLIIDDYYFNPIRMSNSDKLRAAFRTITMTISVIAFLGAIICVIVGSIWAPVLLPIAGTLCFIGMVAFGPYIDDLFDLARCAWYHRAPSAQDIFWSIIYPIALICTLTTTLIINLHPIAADIEKNVSRIFAFIGNILLTSQGVGVGTYFSRLNAKYLYQQAKTPITSNQFANQHVVTLNTAINIINRDKALDQQLDLHKIGETKTTPQADKTPSKLFFLFNSKSSGYTKINSQKDELTQGLHTVSFTSPLKSKLYQSLEVQIKTYEQLSSDATLEVRVALIGTILNSCEQWQKYHNPQFTSRRAPCVQSISSVAEQELNTLKLIQSQVSPVSEKSTSLLLCRL